MAISERCDEGENGCGRPGSSPLAAGGQAADGRSCLRLPQAPKARNSGDAAGAPAVPSSEVSGALNELGERIALLAAQISAATYELLVMLREFDQGGGWSSGFRSCAHWLVWRVGLDLGAAREKVRVARALGELPLLAESLRRGAISYSKVRALTRIATPANEQELLDFARAGTAAHVETLVRGMRRVDRLVQCELAQRQHAARYLRTYSDEDGMIVVKARLSPEAAAALLCAIDAGVEKLHGPRGTAEGTLASHGPDSAAGEVTFEQKRADALVLIAESALAAGLDPGTRGDRYQVVVHVDAEALPAGSDSGSSFLADGTHVSAETSRRLACDAARVVLWHAADGRTVAAGRRTRTISPGLRRALEHRDRGCRFPGCGARLCDAHHVQHWADGGTTDLTNTVLLCRFHHRVLHEDGFSMELKPNGEARFYRPDGSLLPLAPQAPAAVASDHGPIEALAARLASQGVVIDARESLPDWRGGGVDFNWEIQWLGSIGSPEPWM